VVFVRVCLSIVGTTLDADFNKELFFNSLEGTSLIESEVDPIS